jgi:non-specific serine/threonine protein kinase
LAGTNFLQWVGDLEAARVQGEEALAILRELGETRSVGRALASLGVVATTLGDTSAARRLGEEAIVHARAAGDLVTLADVANNLGYLAIAEGEDVRAMSLLEESLALYRELGREQGTGQCLFNLAFLLFRSGLREEAVATARESLAVGHRTGDVRSMIYNLVLLGSVALHQNSHEESARLLGAAEAERGRLGLAFEELEGALYAKTLDDVRAALGDARLKDALAEGGVLSLDQAVARALG